MNDIFMQSEHKIQSGKGNLSIEMDQVPKILKPMVDEWTKGGFIVSFKVSMHFSAPSNLPSHQIPISVFSWKLIQIFSCPKRGKPWNVMGTKW